MESDNKNLNYNSFITSLLNNPSTSKKDRNRIVDLLLKERDKGFVTEEQVRLMIDTSMGNYIGEGNVKSKHTKNKTSKTFYHNPKNMVNFLYKFSVAEEFKWFTHDPDLSLDFDYDKYVNDAEKKKEYDKMSIGINRSTWKNVQNFIFPTDYDTYDSYNKKIDFRWKDLEKWCFENKSKHPFGALLGDYKFERYINIFKNTIEFRTDISDLLFYNRVMDFIYDEAIRCDDINIVFSDQFSIIGKSLRVYIDVRQLYAALKEIGKWVISNKSNNNLLISLNEMSNCYILELFHKNSNMNIDSEKMKGLSGDFHKVRNILLNIADWTIEADINQMTRRLICLDEDTEYIDNVVISPNKIEDLNNKVGGVKYLIKIYKNIQL